MIYFQYHVGQLYMIAKHSSEESKNGEGVEVVENCPIDGNIYEIFSGIFEITLCN